MNYFLPKAVEIGGAEYAIRSDYRAILDICMALEDEEIESRERTYSALVAFYPEFESIPTAHYDEAVDRLVWFINGGEDADDAKSPRLVDWEQDLPLVMAAINKTSPHGDIRGLDYYHWWSFVADYRERIGDCTFAQVIKIREKQARGKSLDKQEREWYRKNRKLVDRKHRYTDAENALLAQWT